MDEKKSLKKKILHWVLLVAIASGLALVVLLLIMFSIMKDEGFFDKSGEKTAKEEIYDKHNLYSRLHIRRKERQEWYDINSGDTIRTPRPQIC